MLVLMNGMVTNLKRHANIRIMHSFMLKALVLLDRERKNMGAKVFEDNCILLFRVGQKYCHGHQQRKEFVDLFNSELQVDIEFLYDTCSNKNEDFEVPMHEQNVWLEHQAFSYVETQKNITSGGEIK